MDRYRASSLLMWMLAILLVGLPRAALAAESNDNCVGYITSLPGHALTPGTWCLKQDLVTPANYNYGTDTYAINIDINATDVILDCRGFTIDGSAGGSTTRSAGIRIDPNAYRKIRHCNIRGFNVGILALGSVSVAIEDNRLDANIHAGIDVESPAAGVSVVRRNLVLNTGGNTDQARGINVVGKVEILDNTISVAKTYWAIGIYSENNGEAIIGNRIRLAPEYKVGTLFGASGISAGGPRTVIRHNSLVYSPTGDPNPPIGTAGIEGCVQDPEQPQNSHVVVKDNAFSGFSNPFANCVNGGGNSVVP